MSSGWVGSFEHHLQTFPTPLLLALVFLLPALEASVMLGFVIPGEIAVVIGGIVASQGHTPIELVIVFAVLGAFVGDQIGYYVGHRWGEALLLKIPDKILGPRRIAAGEEYVRRMGAKAVVLGRWTAALRALVPGIAGMSGMHYRRFTIANFVGGAGWAIACACVGYGAGGSLQKAKHTLSTAGWIGGGVVVALIIFVVARSRRRSEHRMMEELATEGLSHKEELADRPEGGE